MWLPPKVRHLVLINQSPLPPSFLPSSSSPSPTPLLPPHLLSALPIFGEKPACSWDNPKSKTNSQLPSDPWNQRHSQALFEQREKNTSGFSLWKNAYLNCGRIRLRALLGREVRVLWRGGREGFYWRRCGEWKRERSEDACCYSSPCSSMTPSHLPTLADGLWGTTRLCQERMCYGCKLYARWWLGQKYFAADRCLLKSPVSSCLGCVDLACSIFNNLTKMRRYFYFERTRKKLSKF